jgi:hypothetical protein
VTYGHPVYLAETFVDNARFEGTCYKAANWKYVRHTRGSAKKAAPVTTMVIPRLYTFTPCIAISGGFSTMTRGEAAAIRLSNKQSRLRSEDFIRKAEQQMRKAVLTRKVSQQNRSGQGVKAQVILMTLLRTAELQDQNTVETVLSEVKNTIESKNASIGCFKNAA